jgi:hypothetical protein
LLIVAQVEILAGKGFQLFDQNPRGERVLEECTLLFQMPVLNYIFSTGNAQRTRRAGQSEN